MKILGHPITLSESTRRNIYMAPGVLLIAAVLFTDGCSGRNSSASIKQETRVVVNPSIEGETGFRME